MYRFNIIYEVTCNGFKAKDASTNDQILWVYAASKDVIALALEQANLTVKSIQCMRGRFMAHECEFNLTLEDEYADFVNRVRDLGQSFFIQPHDDYYQSVFPSSRSEESQLHSTVEDAYAYFAERGVSQDEIRLK